MSKVIVLIGMLLRSTHLWAFDDCYLGAGVGRSHIGMSGTGQIERLSSDLLQFSAKEDRTSTTNEIYVGCTVHQGFGRLNLELGDLQGILYEIEAAVSTTLPGNTVGISTRAVVGAEGYSIKAVWENAVTKRGHVFVAVGALYVKGTADLFFDEFEVSFHASEKAVVALAGIGWRQEFSQRCSLKAEYSLVGHHKVSNTVLALQCLVTD